MAEEKTVHEKQMGYEEVVEKMLEGLDEMMPKLTAKDLAKMFISGFVGGCSGTLVRIWLTGLPEAHLGMKALDSVVNKVGVAGITSVVGSKVSSEVMQSLDVVDTFISYKRVKAKGQKALLKAKKQKKYVEVEEG